MVHLSLKHEGLKLKHLSLSGTLIAIIILATIIGNTHKANAAAVCTPATAITAPYAKDGVGDVCLQSSSLCTYINSWNVTTLEVNGTAYTNLYVAAASIAPLNGAYTIHYVSSVAWGHFEIGGTCATSPTNTTAPATIAPTKTNTPPPAPTLTGSATKTSTRTNTPAISLTPTLTPTRTRTSTTGPSLTRTATRTNTPPPLTLTGSATKTVTRTNTPGITNTPTATTVVSTGCAGLAICDGFETQTLGAVPSGSWQMIYPDCQGTGSATVDSAQVHTGSRSIRVDGKTGYCNHVFVGNTANLTSIGPVVYGRMFIRATNPLGTDHITFIAMKDTVDNKNLRFGGQGQVMAWNRESDDATAPSMSPVGISTSVGLPINQWSCLEIKVDGTNGYLQTWLNGTSISGLTVDGVSTADIDAAWISSKPVWRPSLSDIKFGWESYSSGDNTLWFDDIAFGSSRIGCGS